MFYGRKCKIFKPVTTKKSYYKKLNIVKNHIEFGGFVAVFVIEMIDSKRLFLRWKSAKLSPIDYYLPHNNR